MEKNPDAPTLLEASNRLVAAWQSNTQPSMQVRHAFMAALMAHEQQQNELLESFKAMTAVVDRFSRASMLTATEKRQLLGAQGLFDAARRASEA